MNDLEARFHKQFTEPMLKQIDDMEVQGGDVISVTVKAQQRAKIQQGSDNILAFIQKEIDRAKKEILDTLDENGYGGGNWRRLLEQLR